MTSLYQTNSCICIKTGQSSTVVGMPNVLNVKTFHIIFFAFKKPHRYWYNSTWCNVLLTRSLRAISMKVNNCLFVFSNMPICRSLSIYQSEKIPCLNQNWHVYVWMLYISEPNVIGTIRKLPPLVKIVTHRGDVDVIQLEITYTPTVNKNICNGNTRFEYLIWNIDIMKKMIDLLSYILIKLV